MHKKKANPNFMYMGNVKIFWILCYAEIIFFIRIQTVVYCFKTINTCDSTTDAVVSNENEKVFLGIFEEDKREQWSGKNDSRLFPKLSKNSLDEDYCARVVVSEDKKGTPLVSIRPENKKAIFTDEEIDRLCELQLIKRKDYNLFSLLSDLSERYDFCAKTMCKVMIDGTILNISFLYKNAESGLHIFTIKYKDNTYEIWKKKNTEIIYNHLFIPEIAFFDHKNICKIYGTFFDNFDMEKTFTIMQYYEQSKIRRFMFDTSEDNHNLIYHVLKMALSVATAIEYLNIVHDRVYGSLSMNNISVSIENERIVYKLTNFTNSAKIERNSVLKVTNKSNFRRYMPPEEMGYHLNPTFCRKSEVWSIGALLLETCEIDYKYSQSFPFVFRKNFLTEEKKSRKKSNRSRQPNCRFSRLEDILTKFMAYDVKDRPKISECIHLLYEEILEEEIFSRILLLH